MKDYKRLTVRRSFGVIDNCANCPNINNKQGCTDKKCYEIMRNRLADLEDKIESGELISTKGTEALAGADQVYGIRQEARQELIKNGINPRLQAFERKLYGALACFEDDRMTQGVLRFDQAVSLYEELRKFLKEVESDDETRR